MQPDDSSPPLTERQALAIAREACARRGWPWQEPVIVKHGSDGTWHLRTNGQARGSNALFVIDKATGRVLSERFAPR